MNGWSLGITYIMEEKEAAFHKVESTSKLKLSFVNAPRYTDKPEGPEQLVMKTD